MDVAGYRDLHLVHGVNHIYQDRRRSLTQAQVQQMDQQVMEAEKRENLHKKKNKLTFFFSFFISLFS
jgi:hypothetical protein